MSDETSLVSGRFTKLENGSPGIGLGSRSRLETSGDSDDRIGWHICLVLADRLSQRGGLSSSGARWTAREEVSTADRKTRTRQYWPDDTDRTRQTAHGNGLREPNRRTRSDTLCDGRSDDDLR